MKGVADPIGGAAAATDRILVVDFGAQYAQLIARRVREVNVFSEIVPHDISAADLAAHRPAGIIFSGGPASVHVEGAPRIDPRCLRPRGFRFSVSVTGHS